MLPELNLSISIYDTELFNALPDGEFTEKGWKYIGGKHSPIAVFKKEYIPDAPRVAITAHPRSIESYDELGALSFENRGTTYESRIRKTEVYELKVFKP